MGVGCKRHAPATLPTGKRPLTLYIGDWVVPRADLDVCGKSRLHRDSIPGPVYTYTDQICLATEVSHRH